MLKFKRYFAKTSAKRLNTNGAQEGGRAERAVSSKEFAVKKLQIALLTLLWFIAANGHEQGPWFFNTVDVKQGLADNFVRDVTMDSEGYIWLSTINGLSRYDGYRMLNFQPQQFGGRSGDVIMVRQTADGTLWMLCSGELLTYRLSTQTWLKDGAERLRAMGIAGSVMRLFYVDDDGGMWVATEQGLWHQSFRSSEGGGQSQATALHSGMLTAPIRHVVVRNGTALVITNDYHIYKVGDNHRLTLLTQHPKLATDSRDSRAMIDSRMNLWLYHANTPASSLWVYSMVSGEWQHPAALNGMDSGDLVNAMAEDGEGRLWVGTANRGICVVDWHGGEEVTSGFGAIRSHITCLYADGNNTMWVGSAKLGAAYTDLNTQQFVHITTEGREDVSALMEDNEGNLWIGFDGEGIVKMGSGERFFAKTSAKRLSINGAQESGRVARAGSGEGYLPGTNITTLATDVQGHILAGTYGGGIVRLSGNRFVPLYPEYDPLRYVKAIVADNHGALWVATVDKGVVRIADERFTNFTTANSQLRSNGVICLAYDVPGDILYIGTSIGLTAYDCARGMFVRDDVLDSLKNVYVTALKVDQRGRLWIGSRDGLWVKGRGLHHLTTDQGLSNKVVRALAIGEETVWVSTDNGLTCITLQGDTLKCRPYLDSDGLHGIVFSNNAALTTRDGRVLLGSMTGICVCNPLQTSPEWGRLSAQQPASSGGGRRESSLQVRFTEFRINGNSVIKSPEGFTIDYGERLGVSLSVMVPALSHKVRYLYRFKGEDEWMRAPGNMLYFTSLMPGNHVLQVKAELPGMATTEMSELTFRVLPPIWLSNWAVLCYLLLLITAVWLVWRAIRRRQRNEVAMKQMEINLKKYEMEEEKIRFFTNISHDLKTPLTLVVAPLEKIRDSNLPEAIRTEIDVAWRNARQLYDLVLELLDFRRLDVGKEKLNLSHGDLVGFVRQTAQAFAYYTIRKRINLVLDLPSTAIETLFDENKMRRIITNLLSNAYKYNVDGGSVTVTLKALSHLPQSGEAAEQVTSAEITSLEGRQEGTIHLSVADTGIGVKDKQHVFDRFVQETHGQEQEGSGLGLHIVRQYVDMMGGSISVCDNQPRGTVFNVTLPLYQSDKIMETASDIHSSSFTILVVEDNADARFFLQRSLEDEYHVLLAANGKEALDQLGKAGNVSIIISDVMMPEMDGMELVRQIRKNIRFSHIPVILLTAKSSEDDIIAGLEEGVADYLTKPYSLSVLRLRIKKILEWTQHIHQQVATGIEIKPSEITVSSLDEELISHVIAEVEANINDPNYSVVQLSTAVGMTRGTLYKKLMAIVGKSPVEFIRIIRIKRGKDLLDQGRTNVSEVADKVGFSPKMFAQYFREMYGSVPSEYLKKRRQYT